MDEDKYLTEKYVEFMNSLKSLDIKITARVNYVHDDDVYECIFKSTPSTNKDGSAWSIHSYELVATGETVLEAWSNACVANLSYMIQHGRVALEKGSMKLKRKKEVRKFFDEQDFHDLP